jgi:hypothetical protein
LPFAESVEGALTDWTVQITSGFNPWSPSTLRSASPATSWFVAGFPEPTESLLVSPTLVALPSAAVLRFVHWLDSEAGHDGGVLEYRTDDGPWLDAGPLFLEGGYDTTIDAAQASPLGGRPAWTGPVGGWRAVAADLSSLAGADVALRWRFATDASDYGEGWYVDDIRVAVERCDPVNLGPPGEASPPGEGPLTVSIGEGGYALQWTPPTSGGPVIDYRLYSVPLAAPWSSPECAGLLGSGTSATLIDLPDDRAFLVVARGAAGEGSYGVDSAGRPRAQAEAAACP